MTAEQNFIKKLEAYLDCEINDYGKRRISGYLKEYAAEAPQIGRVNVVREVPMQEKKEIQENTLYQEAQKICEEKFISIFDFLNPKNGKSTNEMAAIRKEYCARMLRKYTIQKKDLKEFFGVDHTTISHYIHGKQFRKIVRENTANS